MTLPQAVRFAAALAATNLRGCLALRGAFLLQAVFMLLNNLSYFCIWWIFFARFEEVQGWRVEDVYVLFGVVTLGFGLAMLFAGGVRELARMIADGDLDAWLTQPPSVLLQAVGSKSMAAAFGEIATGVLFLWFSGRLDLRSLPAALVAILCSAVVFVASGVVLHSAAFWLGRVDTLARQAWELVITFSLYPTPLFSGGFKLVLFTLLPAGLIAHLPVELVREFTWVGLATAVGGAALYTAVALWIFERGLRAYSSGSRFGVRG